MKPEFKKGDIVTIKGRGGKGRSFQVNETPTERIDGKYWYNCDLVLTPNVGIVSVAGIGLRSATKDEIKEWLIDEL